MPLPIEFMKITVYAVMAVCIMASLAAVMLPKIFHAALGLLVVLTGTAVVFIVLGANVPAAIQIFLYAGTVITLMILTVMRIEHGDKTPRRGNRLSIPALMTLAVFSVFLIRAILATSWPVLVENFSAAMPLQDWGAALTHSYIFPLGVTGVVFTAVGLGASTLVKKDRP